MFGGGLDSPTHILLLLLVVLLVFGAKRLPEIGRSLGSGIREFRHSVSGEALPPAPPARAAAHADAGASPAPAQEPVQSAGASAEDLQRQTA